MDQGLEARSTWRCSLNSKLHNGGVVDVCGRDYWAWSQCLSFDKATARWDSVFFFALSISAYVSPSYSKMGSQPAPVSPERTCVEERSTKVGRTASGYYLALCTVQWWFEPGATCTSQWLAPRRQWAHGQVRNSRQKCRRLGRPCLCMPRGDCSNLHGQVLEGTTCCERRPR